MQENQALRELLSTNPYEGREYLFYRHLDGNPPGQIKAFVRKGKTEIRVVLVALPKEMQVVFIKLTGKRPEELGLTASDSAW